MVAMFDGAWADTVVICLYMGLCSACSVAIDGAGLICIVILCYTDVHCLAAVYTHGAVYML